MDTRGKTGVLVAVLLLAGLAGLAAAGKGPLRLGLEFGDPNAVLIIRPAPFDFKLGYNFAEGSESVFLSGDYRIVNGRQLFRGEEVLELFHLFLGLGAYAQLRTAEGAEDPLTLGGRVPVGLQVFLLDGKLELFLEVCPTVDFLPALGWGGLQGFLGFTLPIR